MARASFMHMHWRRALVVTAVASGLLGMPTAWAAGGVLPIDSGTVEPVDTGDQSKEILEGRSATEFFLRLPEGAACPGDSLHDQWRVQSFIVPAVDDPGSIDYGVVGPTGEGQYALYDVDTRPFTDVLTRQNLRAGEPGVISEVPALSFAVFPPGTLPSGRYRIGIACTFFRSTADYWDTEIVVTTSPDDEPGQLVWRLADAPAYSAPADDTQNNWLFPVVGGLGAAVAVALGWAFWRRSIRRVATPVRVTPRSRTRPLTKESQ